MREREKNRQTNRQHILVKISCIYKKMLKILNVRERRKERLRDRENFKDRRRGRERADRHAPRQTGRQTEGKK
jgi:hypothetical protein